eukprot:6046645-Pleurochrysis_carterae.AAC.1
MLLFLTTTAGGGTKAAIQAGRSKKAESRVHESRKPSRRKGSSPAERQVKTKMSPAHAIWFQCLKHLSNHATVIFGASRCTLCSHACRHELHKPSNADFEFLTKLLAQVRDEGNLNGRTRRWNESCRRSASDASAIYVCTVAY